MKFTGRCFFISAFFACVLPLTPSDAADADRLTNGDRGQREEAAKAIVNDRKRLIKELMGLASEKVSPLPSSTPGAPEYPWHDSKHLAILLLGDLRAEEAVGVLLGNIEYENPRDLFGGRPLYRVGGDLYPAAEALLKIGIPAVDPVIKKLGTYEKDCQGRRNCCWVLDKIYGRKLAKARLQLAIQETEDEKTKENLRAALTHVSGEGPILPFDATKPTERKNEP